MDFAITPYRGVGPLHFGMSAEEIEAAIGTPEQRQTRRDTLSLTYADGASCMLFEMDGVWRLVEVGFGKTASSLSYSGLKLFGCSRLFVLRALARQEPSMFEAYGFLIMPTLGFALTGFHDGIEDDPAVTVFQRGLWDDLLPKATPFAI
jgi:hypothetical protein